MTTSTRTFVLQKNPISTFCNNFQFSHFSPYFGPAKIVGSECLKKYFGGKKNFWSKKMWVQKYASSKKIVGQKKYPVQNKFWVQKIF